MVGRWFTARRVKLRRDIFCPQGVPGSGSVLLLPSTGGLRNQGDHLHLEPTLQGRWTTFARNLVTFVPVSYLECDGYCPSVQTSIFTRK
jgi:hypothetical protein